MDNLQNYTKEKLIDKIQFLENKLSGKEISNTRLKTIYENVDEIIIYVDTRGKILDVNTKIKDILGFKPEEVIDKNKKGFESELTEGGH